MTTLAYQLPTWNWSFTPTKGANTEPRKPRHRVAGRLPDHLQRNLAQLATSEDTDSEMAPVTQQAVLQWMGQSSDDTFSARECVSIKHRGRQILTAVRTAENQLNLISWRVNADGSIACTGSSGTQAGQASQIGMARARKFVVAYRTGDRRLQLSSWDVSNTGAIYRAGESIESDEIVHRVKLVALNDDLLITACITKDRQLTLISWQLGQDNALIRLQERVDTSELVRDVAVVALPAADNRHQLVTVVRTITGQIKLLSWKVADSGMITPGLSQAGLDGITTQIDAAVDPHGQIITSLRTLDGHLRLVVWRLEPGGNTILPVFDTGNMDERIRHQALMCSAIGILTAVCTAPRQLKLIAWDVDQAGAITRTCESESMPTAAGPIILCPELLDGNAPILTATQTAQGMLKLMTWRV